ncbi:MAG: hypothetical protein ABSH20_08065 [Tepidisphaeraceae bacterium]|jgi:hypothetical protein
MTTNEHTPGPWQQHWQFIVAPDPEGIHPDIYIAEIAEEDSEGRIASPQQQKGNGRLIVAAPALFAACQMVIDRWEHGDLAEAARACHTAVNLASHGRLPWDITDDGPAGSSPYSVLLLYPDYVNDSGTETYYAFVQATSQIEAITLAQRQAATAQKWVEMGPEDFTPLLVTQGHHASASLFNK